MAVRGFARIGCLCVVAVVIAGLVVGVASLGIGAARMRSGGWHRKCHRHAGDENERIELAHAHLLPAGIQPCAMQLDITSQA